MTTIMNIFLVVPTSLLHHKMVTEMNNCSWFAIGAITAFIQMIYLIIRLVKPEKF